MENKFSKYINNGNLKVYLAGPFFSDEQTDRIVFIENVLDEYEFDVFSPRKATKIKKGCSYEDMKETFNQNINNIDKCDFVLAILDSDKGVNHSDDGTVFEFGYAYSKNKPVLCFNENRECGANLMLALSGKLPFVTKYSSFNDIFDKRISDYCIKENINADKKVARVVLRNILLLIKKYGVERVIDMTKALTKEII